MKITWNKLVFMHGSCTEKGCPVCDTNSTLDQVSAWVYERLTVIQSGCKGPRPSPWWLVQETEEQGYPLLRGNLRGKGYYDK